MTLDTHGDRRRWGDETGDFRDRLYAVAAASTNYSGSVVDHDKRQVVVHGVGAPTEELAAVMDEAPPTINVTWRQCAHTLVELTDEVLRVMAEHPNQLNSGGARSEGTGIQFTTTDRVSLGSADPTRALGARYPVTLQYGGRPIPLSSTRRGQVTSGMRDVRDVRVDGPD
jgi:hypothetical protein